MASSTAKIRVGLIGLNAPHVGEPTGSSWAASAHLPYLLWSDKYEIVALQNSSEKRAQEAIKAHGLDATVVKAYGTPEDLANDPNVDLVVSAVRVDRHGGSIIPSIKAKKSVFVEWPLEANEAKSRVLAELVKEQGVKNAVGLQGGYVPVIKKLKELIAAGTIGRVESSTLIAKTTGGRLTPSVIDYFANKEVGGNMVTIGFGHIIEYVSSVLGELSSSTSVLVNQYPTTSIYSSRTKEILDEKHPNNVPTQLVFNGLYKSGTLLTLKMQTRQADNGSVPATSTRRPPDLDWRIFGTKGEIRITDYTTWALNTSDLNTHVEVSTVDHPEYVKVDVDPDELSHLPVRARSIARLYEAFASGKGEYPDFEHALKGHELIESMFKANGF